MLAVRSALQGGKHASKRLMNPAQMQQRRGMAGGEDDSASRVNWWDAPQNPDIWQKHQLAWWTVAAYTGVYYAVSSLTGGKKEAKEAAK